MTLQIDNGDCLELMRKLPDKSVDLFICDLPYGETNCKWDSKIDLDEFWSEFRRLRKSKKTACIHFCSTKFGYTLIKSWEKGFKMDMVTKLKTPLEWQGETVIWKKRNKTGGLQSRHRPMRNHEMVYFFYEQAPKYNRDKYHKRIATKNETINGAVGNITNAGNPAGASNFSNGKNGKFFEPPNPASVVEEIDKSVYGTDLKELQDFEVKDLGKNHRFNPPNPSSVVEEDEPKSMFESTKVFIGKRHHQTEKPHDILEFFLKYWSDEGETILDPTMGSGSTGVACKKLNRNFIGYELDEKIFEVAKKRLF